MHIIKNKTLELLQEKLEFEEGYLIGLEYDVEVAPSKEYKQQAKEQVKEWKASIKEIKACIRFVKGIRVNRIKHTNKNCI